MTIVTPNDTHYEIAKLFMEKDFHIVCDNPLALTVEQAEELAALAKQQNLLFAITDTYSAACLYNYEKSTRLSRTAPGHPEGLFEAFGNIYRSFCEVLLARKEGRIPESFTFPTVEDGVIGVRFVNACVESNRQGSVWVDV